MDSTERGIRPTDLDVLGTERRALLKDIYSDAELEIIENRIKTLMKIYEKFQDDQMILWILKEASATLLGIKPDTCIYFSFKEEENPGQMGMLRLKDDAIYRLRDAITYGQSIDPTFNIMFHLSTGEARSIAGTPMTMGSLDIFSPIVLREAVGKSIAFDDGMKKTWAKLGITAETEIPEVVQKIEPVFIIEKEDPRYLGKIPGISRDETATYYGTIYGYPLSAAKRVGETGRLKGNDMGMVYSKSMVYNFTYPLDEADDASATYTRLENAYALNEEALAAYAPDLSRQYDGWEYGKKSVAA